MPEALKHPSAPDLAAYAAGKLTGGSAGAVARHLETCSTCRLVVARFPRPAAGTQLPSAQWSASGATTRPPVPPGKPPPDVPPELIDHPKFRVVRELGRGGMGVVYQADHKIMDKPVALKVINPSVLDHPEILARFHGEVKVAGRLDHPHIVRALDAEQAGKLHLLVMEFVEGQSLADLVRQKGPLPVALACHYARQAALGLQHAFEQGMVHRDIKPHNLMLTPRGVVKILDFGLARVRTEQARGGLTHMGAFMGTPEYVSPEQATDARTADIRADVYSLGCTLYCLLTGRPPFVEETAVLAVLAHLEKQPPPLRELRPDVPPELATVVARALVKDPAGRFQTPAEFAQALVPFIKAGGEGPAKPAVAPAPIVDRIPTATILPGDTGRLPPPVKRDVPRAKSLMPESLLEGLERPTPPKKGTRKRKPGRKVWWKRPVVLVGVGILLLVLGGVGVFRVRTAGGSILVVEVNEPNADVFVDGAKVAVTWGDGGKKAEVRVKPGTRQVEVKKDGFTADGETVTLREGGRRVLVARLTPAPGKAPAGDKPGDKEEGFVSLFNGQDLTGGAVESGDPEQWTVEGGVLVGSRQGTQRLSALLSDRDYSHFVLRFEYRPVEASSFSGVVYRAEAGETVEENNQTWPLHPNLGLGRKNQWGIEPTGRLWWRLGRSLPANKKVELKDPNEWNEVEVQVHSHEVRMAVNGEEVSRNVFEELAQIPDALEGYQRSSGRIGFQALDRGAQFRNVRVKELPDDGAVPEPGGPRTTKRFPAEHNGDSGKWCVIGKHLVQPTLDPNVCLLFGENEWADYDFSVDVQRISGDDQVGFFFRNQDFGRNMYLFSLGWGHNTTNTFEQWADGVFAMLMRQPQPAGLFKTGEWYAARVEVRGNQAKCFLDGRQVFSFDALRSPSGGVGLRTWATAYAFRNIRVTTPEGKVLLEGLPELPAEEGK